MRRLQNRRGLQPTCRRGPWISGVSWTEQEKRKPRVSLVLEFPGRKNKVIRQLHPEDDIQPRGFCPLEPDSSFITCGQTTTQTDASWEDCPLPRHDLSLTCTWCSWQVHHESQPLRSMCFPQAVPSTPPLGVPLVEVAHCAQPKAISRMGDSNRYAVVNG